MKRVIFSLIVCVSALTYAQVGINTTNPNSSLEIQSSSVATPSNTDGILIPKIDEFPLSDPGAAQDGMMVFATGNGSVAKGFYYWDQTANLWTSFDGNQWKLNGNAGTNIANDYIGTSDNTALSFRTNDTEKLRITTQGKLEVYNTGQSVFIGEGAGASDNLSNNRNIAIGYNSLNSALNQNNNVAIGFNSQLASTGGTGNVSAGSYSLVSNTTGDYNTALAIDALRLNTIGSYNSAVGSAALYDNVSGERNVAIGTAALGDNTDGNYNVGIGMHAIRNNTSGIANTAAGYQAMYSNTASNNSVFGYQAMYRHTTGANNLAMGSLSGYLNIVGSGNIFLGYSAGYNETGSNQLYIENSNSTTPLLHGDFATDDITVNGNLTISTASGTYTNATIDVDGLEISNLGASNLGLDGDVVPFASTTFDLGNNIVGENWDDVVANNFVTFSDRRTKNSITDLSYGLEELMALRPVSYKYNSNISPDNRKRLGLIAQEVEMVIPEVVINDDVDLDENGQLIRTPGDYKGLNYSELVPVLIRAMQEQNKRIDALERELSTLKKAKSNN